MARRPLSLVPLFMTAFLDLLGLGIIIPVLAPIFLDASHGILTADTTLGNRTLLLGVLTAAYPLSQFFSAPILGDMSDRYGRRRILLLSLIGTLIGYLIFAYGLVLNSLWLLFVSRLLSGFTGGNITIVQSAIADSSNQEARSNNFGLIGIALALGFIFGPFVGGKLADPTIVSWFDYATPFWFAAMLAAVNIILVMWKFPETLRLRKSGPIHLLTGLVNLKKAFTNEHLRVIFAVIFLFTFGFYFFAQFFQVYLVTKFHFTQSAIGDLFAYTGLWLAVTQGIIIRPLAKRYPPEKILRVSIFLLAVTFPTLLLPSSPWALYLIIPFLAIFQGLSVPTSTALVSNLTKEDSQGEVLGINQSIQSLGQGIPPIVAGVVVAWHMNAPIIVAAIVTLLGWYIFVVWFPKTKQSLV